MTYIELPTLLMDSNGILIGGVLISWAYLKLPGVKTIRNQKKPQDISNETFHKMFTALFTNVWMLGLTTNLLGTVSTL